MKALSSVKISIFISLIFLSISFQAVSQEEKSYEPQKQFCLSPGILHGGGSLIGVDFEVMPFSRIGIQLGAGLLAYGGSINIHLKPDIRSSYFALQYWHQGVGESFAQSALGPGYVFRGKRWLTFNIGFAIILDQSKSMASKNSMPFMMTYGIGAYFPF